MPEVQESEILEIYSEAKRKVSSRDIIIGVVIVVSLVLVIVNSFFDPDDAPIFDIKHITEDLPIISIVLSVILFLFSQIAERSKELHDIGDGEKSREIIKTWLIRFIVYRKASNFGLFLVLLLSSIGTLLIVSAISDLTGKLYNICSGSTSEQIGAGTLILFFGFLMRIALFQVDPDPTVHWNNRIYKVVRLNMYISKTDAISARITNGLWRRLKEVVGCEIVRIYCQLKEINFKNDGRNNKRNIVRVVFISICILMPALIVVILLMAYANYIGVEDFMVIILLLRFFIESLLSLVFLFAVYPALLVADKYSIDGLYSHAMLIWYALSYLVISVVVAAKTYFQLPDSVEVGGKNFIFIGLVILSFFTIMVMNIFINFQRKKYIKWELEKQKSKASGEGVKNEKPPILYRSAVKTMEGYEQRIKELDSDLKDSLEKSQSTRQAAGNAKMRYRSKTTQPPFRPRRR